MKCGTSLAAAQSAQPPAPAATVLAPMGATALKCPNCGAPISPKFGEMVVNCEYCGTGVTLGSDGWKGIQKQTMLPLKYAERDKVIAIVRERMDQGMFHRRLFEDSKLEEMNLNLVPYWIVSASATTSVVATNVAVKVGEVAVATALTGLFGSAKESKRGDRNLGRSRIAGSVFGSEGDDARASYEIADHYNFPIVAIKSMFEHQPRDYVFNLDERSFFEVSKVPEGVKILNGDIGEEGAKTQAKALVTQLQSEKAHKQYHMIHELHTDVDVADAELLHAPIWFARYDRDGKKIVLVVDANSGGIINTIGL